MTLQQKILAKQSKKGFTLVELVVVIAILAILAAIAIPAVIGIINSANTSSAQSDASTLDAACKNFYAGVVSGTINKDTKGSVTATLPASTASTSAKKSSAKALTVLSAIEYNGIKDKFGKDDDLKDFQYKTDGVGTITYVGDDGSVDTGNKQLTTTTTFGTMYKSDVTSTAS